jgi:hypothetical protein
MLKTTQLSCIKKYTIQRDPQGDSIDHTAKAKPNHFMSKLSNLERISDHL